MMRFLLFFFLVTFLSGSANALPILHSFPKEQKQTLSEMVGRVNTILNFYKKSVVYPKAAAGFFGQALNSNPNKKAIKGIVDNFTKLQALLKNIKKGHTMSIFGESAKKHVMIVDFFVPIVNKMIKSQYSSCKSFKPGPLQYDAYVSRGEKACVSYKDMEVYNIDLDRAKEEIKKYAKRERLSMPLVY